MIGSPALKRRSKFASPDPVVRGRQESQDALDIVRDARRQLPDYDADSEEITARHEVPEIRIRLESAHESEPPVKKQLKAGLVAVGSGIGVILLGGLAALIDRCGHH